MSASPFPLKSTLGRSYRVDLGDTRRTKEALLRLGYFKTPSYGLTDYPDEPLFAAIEDFQRANNLYRDGIMRPDGETATRLGRILSEDEQRALSRTPGINPAAEPYRPRGYAARLLTAPRAFGLGAEIGAGRANRPRDVIETRKALGWAGYAPSGGGPNRPGGPDPDLFEAIERFQAGHGLEVDGWMRPGGPTARALDQAVAPKVAAWREAHPEEAKAAAEQAGEVQTAFLAPALRAGRILAPLVIGPIGDWLGRQAKRHWSEDTSDAGTPEPGSPRTVITDPPPPVPPSEPDGEKPGYKEELPNAPPEIPKLEGRPINEVLKNDPLIFQEVSEELRREFEQPLESHKGNEITQWGNMRTAQLCEDEFKAWGPGLSFEHVGGAYRLNEDGSREDLKELLSAERSHRGY